VIPEEPELLRKIEKVDKTNGDQSKDISNQSSQGTWKRPSIRTKLLQAILDLELSLINSSTNGTDRVLAPGS